MAAFKCLLSLCLLAVTATAQVVEPTAAMLMTTGAAGLDGAVLLQAEGQRLGELSKRDIHYASVIGELRAEIDALR